jgi:hypothetical protein
VIVHRRTHLTAHMQHSQSNQGSRHEEGESHG